jgi:hypothetical protein
MISRAAGADVNPKSWVAVMPNRHRDDQKSVFA